MRDSASAGNASSASKAAVRRRPWPSLWRRWTPAAVVGWLREAAAALHAVAGWGIDELVGRGGGATPRLSAACGRMIEPTSRLLGIAPVVRSRAPRRCAAAPRRGRAPRASRRCPARRSCPASATRSGWKTSRGLAPARLDDLVERGLDRVDGRTARRRASAARASASARAAVLAEPLLARLRVVGRAVEDEARQRPEVGQRLDLLAARSRPPARRSPSRPV